MGVSKLNLYEPGIRRLSHFHKALGHPARVQILELIRNGDAYTCLQFSKSIGLSQSSISDHLKVLRGCEFVQQQIVFNEAFYSLNSLNMKNLRNLFDRHLKELEAA